MTLRDTMTFEDDGHRTIVSYAAESMPEGAARLVEPLMPRGLKKRGDDAAAERPQEVLGGL